MIFPMTRAPSVRSAGRRAGAGRGVIPSRAHRSVVRLLVAMLAMQGNLDGLRLRHVSLVGVSMRVCRYVVTSYETESIEYRLLVLRSC